MKEQRLRQVSPTEKTVTNKDLTRVMVKTWSWMQTATTGHVGQMYGNQIMIEGPKVGGNEE